MANEFKLPELGENIHSGTLTRLLVSRGDSVQKDQPLIELETDKAVIEVPSDQAGIVQQILVSEGDEINVGQKIILFGEKVAAADSPKKPQKEIKESAPPVPPSKSDVSQMEGSVPKEPQKSADPKVPAGKTGSKVYFLPDLGENIESGTITKLLVSEGDHIEENQNVLELETEKAVVEIPASMAGTVKNIFVKEGTEIKVGDKILEVSVAGEQQVREEIPPPKEAQEVPQKATSKETEKSESEMSAQLEQTKFSISPEKLEVVPAAPSVRRFAREIGITIGHVPGTGPGGRISVDDVKNYARTLNQQKRGVSQPLEGIEAEALPDFTRWGEIERQPMSKVRQKTARHLSYAWATIPHVTQFDKADITQLEKVRKQFSKQVEIAGGKLTVTAIILKIVGTSLKKFPQFNASVDMEKSEIIFKKYVNVGIAVDTDRGLLVPVVRDVDRKNIIQLSIEISELAQKARDKKLSLEEMQGGNFSISNLGGIGGTGFTPVVNSPEVAILGISRGEMQQIYKDGEFVSCLMLPLSLSYDHRIIDGADAARFLRWVAEAIENPFKILLEG